MITENILQLIQLCRFFMSNPQSHISQYVRREGRRQKRRTTAQCTIYSAKNPLVLHPNCQRQLLARLATVNFTRCIRLRFVWAVFLESP